MRLKFFALLALIVAALSLTGCDKGRAQMAPREANLLGVVKVQKENYTPSGRTTFAISTDELYGRKNFSGDKTTLLWGLVTLKDY
jgi:hypothetical protein